ncbi:GNAT family N-acetyltransferase [Granulicella sp. WH15]|nr:GNAT family N-acetyltransferase [Granulicella sp. WH15]
MRTAEDAEAFRVLNEEWITNLFTLEEKDRGVLGDPEGKIVRPGGRVFVVYAEQEAVGCVALIFMGEDQYELAKMAVSPKLRGLGIGRKLIEYAIGQARGMGAKKLVLGTNSKLGNAVHLYEAVGFEHRPPKGPAAAYARADVYMEMEL